jgi:lincosamide nucleotidyltransferase B/F
MAVEGGLPMLLQRRLIDRVIDLAHSDDRIAALLMYGAFAADEGDRYSDIEFYVYIAGRAFAAFDENSWLANVAPVRLRYRNEYGVTTAIFDGLVRGEFHFGPAASIPELEKATPGAWISSIEDSVVYDRSGRVTEALARSIGRRPDRGSRESVEFLAASVANWALMVDNLRRRGEHARALDFLYRQLHPHLLRLARVAEGSTGNWLSPTRRLELELGPASYRRYGECTAALEPADIRAALHRAWQWFRELRAALHIGVPDEELTGELTQRLIDSGDEAS